MWHWWTFGNSELITNAFNPCMHGQYLLQQTWVMKENLSARHGIPLYELTRPCCCRHNILGLQDIEKSSWHWLENFSDDLLSSWWKLPWGPPQEKNLQSFYSVVNPRCNNVNLPREIYSLGQSEHGHYRVIITFRLNLRRTIHEWIPVWYCKLGFRECSP